MDVVRYILTRLQNSMHMRNNMSKHNNVIIILILGAIVGNVVKSTNLNTENMLSSHQINQHQRHHNHHQQQQQFHQYLLNQQLEQQQVASRQSAKNLTNANLPLASRIASLPGDSAERPLIVRDNKQQQHLIQYLRPQLSTQSVIARSSQATDSLARSQTALTTQSRQQRNDNTIGQLCRGARDSVGSLAKMVSSYPLASIATTAALAGLFAVPFVAPDLKRSLAGVGNLEERMQDMQGRLESFVGWIERSVEVLPALPRLHPLECVKRAVCEVHHDRKKYGIPGLILQVMFPAELESDGPSKVINKYKLAAGYGRYNTSQDPDACSSKYEECVVNLLDIVQNLMGFILQ